MDEPLSNLDARLRVQMRGELKRLQQELGTTTIYVTHDQAEAMTLAHRVAVMRNGQLQQFDTPMAVYDRPANRFVAEFVGNPGMNFISGTIDLPARTFHAPGIALPLEADNLARLHGAETKIVLGIRPEHLHVSAVRRDDWLPATVYVTELMGNETFVFLMLEGEKVIARAPADFRAEVESTVWIKLETEKAHFFDPASGARLG
jgi:multiple sugar transport system ATP-binding protein